MRPDRDLRIWHEDLELGKPGVGEALTREGQRLAEQAGVDAVELTSRAEREAANRLYRRLGFELRETNVYVWRSR